MINDVQIGIIGGSGIYELENMKILTKFKIKTPFGRPSDNYVIGDLNGKKVAFLARHGKGHKILPGELNSKANIYGFKKLGVKHLIAISAVGSLREEIKPTHLVFPNQIIDRTKGRPSTFFGNGIVTHIGFADPFCGNLINIYEEAAKKLKITYHRDKTYVCMEGPAFSTRAESHFHRQIGGDLIGMTAIPEAKLAREAEICYAMIALSTDYDCWREDEEDVTIEMVLANMKKNSEASKKMLGEIISLIKNEKCKCHETLKFSIITPKNLWPNKTVSALKEILPK